MMRAITCLGVFCLLATAVRGGETTGELAPPVHVMAGGEPMDTERIGHAAPFFGDFDGDGLADLLVGEYYQGRLRVYRNIGTAAKPAFGDYTWFHAGAELGRVPSG